MDLRVLKRIPATEKELPLVFSYGGILAMKNLFEVIEWSPKEREKAEKLLYENNIKPTADIVREHFNVSNAVSFSPETMEFIILEADAEEVNFYTTRD